MPKITHSPRKPTPKPATRRPQLALSTRSAPTGQRPISAPTGQRPISAPTGQRPIRRRPQLGIQSAPRPPIAIPPGFPPRRGSR